MGRRWSLFLNALLAVSLLAGCASGQPAPSPSADDAANKTQQAADEQVIGDHYALNTNGVVDLSVGGLTFKLPQSVKADGYEIAGLARIDSEIINIRLYLCDPNEDLVTQPCDYGFFEVQGIPVESTMDEVLKRQDSPENPVLPGVYDCFTEIGSNQTFRYYFFDIPKMASIEGPIFTDEFLKGRGYTQEYLDATATMLPYASQIMEGITVNDIVVPKAQKAQDIEASKLAGLVQHDLQKNKVKLADIFAQNKLTLIEVWKTTCSPCVQEMPDLQALATEYGDQGFGVMGACVDVIDNGEIDEDTLADALDIVKTTGTTYPTILADETFFDIVDVTSTPTILVVDSKGNVIEGPVRGSYGKYAIEELIKKNL